jgi:hypothetical protein
VAFCDLLPCKLSSWARIELSLEIDKTGIAAEEVNPANTSADHCVITEQGAR